MTFQKLLAVIILAGVTIISGAMQGHATFRWGASAELQAAANRLAQRDLSTKDWKLDQQQSFDAAVLRTLGAEGYLKQIYKNTSSGELVAAALFVGPTGPMVAHTPMVCYPASGYVVQTASRTIEVVSVDGKQHNVAMATFRADNAQRSLLRVYYGWAAPGETYSVPESPRVAFADTTFLYRLQVTVLVEEDEPESDAALDFLRNSLAFAQ